MARGGPNHPLRTKSDTPPLRSSQLATLDVQSKDLSQGTPYNMYRQGLSRYPLDSWLVKWVRLRMYYIFAHPPTRSLHHASIKDQ